MQPDALLAEVGRERTEGDWRWAVGRALGLRESHCEWQPHSCCCAETGPVPPSPLRSPWSLFSREDLEAHGFKVQVGQLRLYDHDKLIKVTQIIRHPKFNQSLSAQGGADIALLKLETPVPLSRLVSLVTLPPASLKVPERKVCWVTGWGYIRLGGKRRETWRVWRCRQPAGGVAVALLKMLYSLQFGGIPYLFIVATYT